MKILFLGDVVGKKGRWALSQFLREFKKTETVDFVIANVENAAGGFGITAPISKKIKSYGVDVQTSGNHIWDRPEFRDFLDKNDFILRPANYPVGLPGQGSIAYRLPDGRRIGVLNLEGREFLSRIDCPFRVADAELTLLKRETDFIVVDFHAESVEEKQALGFYLDGRVSAFIGTHTHVQTADEKILPSGTAYITDVGMCGAYDSVLGMNKKTALDRFITGIPFKFSVAENDVKVAGVSIEIDDQSGRTATIKRVLENTKMVGQDEAGGQLEEDDDEDS